jgi:hypothetical protein
MSIPFPDQPSWGRSQFPPIGDYGSVTAVTAVIRAERAQPR